MNFVDGVLQVESFLAVTLGIVVLFLGRRLTQASSFLKEFSIPEPVSGGILVSVLFTILHYVTQIDVQFDLATRDLLLVYFFTTIGINASLQDLFKGGKPLLILLSVTIGYMLVQNLTGIGIATMLGQPEAVGLLSGTVSLIGGHGTAIAWSPRIAEIFDLNTAMEIGIASATFGLILASLMGGPIAKYLINKHNLKPTTVEEMDVGTAKNEPQPSINAYDFLDAMLAIHVCIILGAILNEGVSSLGLELPLFVTCLFAGILISNVIPASYPRITGTRWPARKPAVALIADMALGAFLAMSLMSMQLWALVDLAGPIFIILGAQFLVAICIAIFVVFPLMGKNYDAAVVCSGFGGISLGSTPTAMANMSAVAQKYGNSHQAFIIVPLVCAFFIDLANALIIPYFIKWIG
ncbi:sodium/glutamate symporter [Vibrio rotiferianus]|jgi:ESS family glutamate:Na+ symporter|uniref:Sodium/glutamate symporter n=1 Tax=Vibrio rotiferianus TaxID=190895 RepID=A0A2K7SPN6_9VIBR|nr:sodium/glutamate symporter [Vibrio rotiferianus]NOH65999.1 sodium/glutamate symporter [Vibrio rotiferianus]OHY89138.1 sodium/glutamate symporter [Vibrio rotiferianus]PIB10721.1 glutamate permease [Vibrio rotiferianus CAIM 577 = LMG 21460]TMX42733.1 sodium/glutamate symporter [Vibrio rotiferianus]TMX51232.1 sodium/glutamate symporter [Vibrio rotiferianus]